MRVPEQERGTALLTVLLLVAVMATVAAAALDRIGVGTRFIANATTMSQGRAWLEMAEQLTATRIEDALAADNSQMLGQGWLGVERGIDLPDGTRVMVTVADGGNCFNLNGLVQRLQDGRVIARPAPARQFVKLMTLLGIAEGEATAIAASAADYIDADSSPLPGGGEGGDDRPVPNQLMADRSELRLVRTVTDRQYRLMERWVCALPAAEPAPINVNTLLPEQAPLLAMLAPTLDLARARAQISSRPADGFGSVLAFWQSPALAGVDVPPEATEQVKVRTSFFEMRARTVAGEMEVAETALFDARTNPVRLRHRTWGSSI